MPGARIGLDNPAFAGRLRTNSRRSDYERRAVISSSRAINDVRRLRSTVKQSPTTALATVSPSRSVHRVTPKNIPSRQTRSTVLMRRLVRANGVRRGRRRFNARGVALSSFAAILFLFGTGVGLLQLHTNKEVKAQVKTLAAQSQVLSDSSDSDSDEHSGLPSEDLPKGNVSSYKVAPESPKIISISKLGVKARVLRMGLKSNGEIKTPNNIYDTGWFENSARPGELGAVFIDAHVHGPTKPGVFAGIKKLRPGDKIKIERGDGKIFTYSVVKNQLYDKDKVDMGAVLNSAVPGKPGLNLMTCDGHYKADGGYDKRIVVFAVQD